MYKILKKNLKIIKKSKKKKVFFFGSTVKRESNSFYITNIRENKKFIYFGAVIYSNYHAKKIASIVDGHFNLAFVDLEKKVNSKNKNVLINLEREVKDKLIKTEVFTYKGNDLTVQACETLINDIYTNDIRGVGGKKALILGAGNIGFKIAQKLVESGSNVYLYRRNKKLLKKIVFTINSLLPKATIARAKSINKINNLKKFDLIVGTTNGIPLLKKKHILNLKKDANIIDVGKGLLEKKALKLSINQNIFVYRLDVSPAYEGYLENIYSTKNLYLNKFISKRKIKNVYLIKRGILAQENSIIVDNVSNPKKIYGISDGKGSFKKISLKKFDTIKRKYLRK
tara:strand:- start:10 stop:1032 length:1023 start_codon:yes stop_codon:yes gene_type:complete